MADKKKKSAGRPCKFSDTMARRIFDLAKAGKTDAQIANAVGISRSTLSLWKNKVTGFSDLVKCAKDIADEMVVAALFKRAVGYSHRAVKFFYDKDKGEVVFQRYTEAYPPDTTACIFWLKNRRRSEWTDTTRHESDELHTIKVIVEEFKE